MLVELRFCGLERGVPIVSSLRERTQTEEGWPGPGVPARGALSIGQLNTDFGVCTDHRGLSAPDRRTFNRLRRRCWVCR
jgi:hypothetical protein